MFGMTGAVAVAVFGGLAAIAWAAAHAWREWLAHRFDAPRAQRLPVEDAARLERMEAGWRR